MTSKLFDAPLALIGDLGATHTRVALVQGQALIAQSNYSTQDASDLESLLEKFLNDDVPQPISMDEIMVSCFGVAGHVSEGEAFLTNVGWKVSESAIRDFTNAPALVVNDFYAQAVAMPLLDRRSLTHICGPDQLIPKAGRSIAVLGAGSGLGEAILVPKPYDVIDQHNPSTDHELDDAWIAVATEGGHARFAPRNEAEVGLNRWLQGRYGEHISVERVVSGMGLVDLFSYFLGARSLPDGYTEPLTGQQVSQAAFERYDPIALDAISHFVGVYADEAANLTLKSNAGIVFLSGGVTPHLLPAIHEQFPSNFIKKGRYQRLLGGVSVWAVTIPHPGLLGAQVLAERLLNSISLPLADS